KQEGTSDVAYSRNQPSVLEDDRETQRQRGARSGARHTSNPKRVADFRGSQVCDHSPFAQVRLSKIEGRGGPGAPLYQPRPRHRQVRVGRSGACREAIGMTRYQAIQLAITALCIVAAASSVRAHHSHATFYDPCKSLTLEGRLESIQWKQPHILL